MTPTADDHVAAATAAYYVDLIDRLLAGKNYDWCRDTLEGIRHTIDLTGRVTLRQREAIDHIMTGRLKHDVR
jgi:hypothetical protein